MSLTAFNINDLENVAAKDAALQNTVINVIGRKVYSIAGQQVTWDLSTESVDESLKVVLQFNGQNIVLGISLSLVNALLKDEGVGLTELNADLLDLLGRLKLIPKLPQGLALKAFVMKGEALEPSLQLLGQQLVLRASMADSGELLNWDVVIYTLPQTSLGAFLKGFESFVVRAIPSPLLNARVPMPIIAAKTSIPAEQAREIAVGDVILFG